VLADTTFTKYPFFSSSQGNAAYYIGAGLLAVASGGGSSSGDAVSKSCGYKTTYEKDERNDHQQ
jgi:hypothetical protein